MGVFYCTPKGLSQPTWATQAGRSGWHHPGMGSSCLVGT